MTSTLIDFSDFITRPSAKGGQQGKRDLDYQREPYFLKFGRQTVPRKNHLSDGTYIDSPISEWLGCHVFEHFGIPAQETILGTYKGRIVCACKDFIESRPGGAQLVAFEQLVQGADPDRANTRLLDRDLLLDILEQEPALEGIRAEAEDAYWRTTIVDAIIGNYDRHDGNWGFIRPYRTSPLTEVAPVYDCGSSFVPMMSETAMQELLDDNDKLRQRINREPRAYVESNGRRLSFPELLMRDYAYRGREILIEMADDITDLDVRDICSEHADVLGDTRIAFYDRMARESIRINIQPAYDLACDEHDLLTRDLCDRGIDLYEDEDAEFETGPELE